MAHVRQLAEFLLALMAFCELAAAQSPPEVPRRDFQEWTQIAVNYRFATHFTFTSFAEVRPGNNVSQFSEELASTGIAYSGCRFASIGGGYLYLRANPDLTGLDHENRLYVEAMGKTPAFHGFVISDRIRPEVRWLQVANTVDKFIVPGSQAVFAQRYRNRMTLEHPITLAQRNSTAFLKWEKFYDTLTHGWTRTRYYAGFDLPISTHVTMENYYMYQRDVAAPPFVRQAVGISFSFGLQRKVKSAE
jgi:hypothetical protein